MATQETTKKIPLKQYWALLRAYLKPQWPHAILLALLLFSNIGLRLNIPAASKRSTSPCGAAHWS